MNGAHVLRFLLLCCAVLLCGALSAVAQSVTVEGVPLRVDVLRPVDQNLVEVGVEGDRRIVARDQLEDTVVTLFFKPGGRAHGLPQDALSTFIKNSLDSRRWERASAALPFYLAYGTLDTISAHDELQQWAAIPEAGIAYRDALIIIRQNGETFSKFRDRPELVAVVLFTIGLHDKEWLRSNAVRWVFAFSESFKAYSLDLLAHAAQAKDRTLLREVPEVVRAAMGDEDTFYRSLRILGERLGQALSYTPQQSADELYPLVEAARRDEAASRILYPVVAQKMHEAAEFALEEGAPSRALHIIARTDPLRRSPRTHEILQKALSTIRESEGEVLRDPEVEATLMVVSERDTEVRRSYEALLMRQIRMALANNDGARGAAILARLVKVRPDPDPANDDVRVSLALAELRSGSREGALAQLAGIRTGIPALDRIRLGLAGLYVNRFVAFVCVVVPLVYVVWFLLVELRRLRAYRLSRSSRARVREAERTFAQAVPADDPALDPHRPSSGEDRERAFTNGVLRKPTDPRLAEYRSCLSVLVLPPEASEKEIKSAYRSLVKFIHPDRLKENKGLASDRFIELTQAYDRAIELRRLTGIEEG